MLTTFITVRIKTRKTRKEVFCRFYTLCTTALTIFQRSEIFWKLVQVTYGTMMQRDIYDT